MMIRCFLTMATYQCSYEQLVQMHPEVDDYKLYYAQVCSERLVHVCRALFPWSPLLFLFRYSLCTERAPILRL